MKLSEVDKIALCGYMRNPLMSIRDLADFLDINYWTLYKSIERLKKREIFKEVVIPDFRNLGFELLVVGYGSLTKRRMQAFEKIKKHREERCPPFACGIFYSFSESYRGFVIGVSKNYTDIVKGLLYTEKVTHMRDILRSDDLGLLLLPFELTDAPIFFDYSSVICKDFGMDMESAPMEMREKEKLGKRDVMVLKELIKRPDGTITDISDALGMSKQTVSKIRKRIFQEGWAHKKVVPNMKALDYDVLVFAHWEMDPEKFEEMKGKQPEELGFDTSNVVFAAYTPLEGAAMAPFKSLKESREMVNSFQRIAENTGIIYKEPKLLFLSIQEGNVIRDHTFQGLVELIPDGPIMPGKKIYNP